MENLSIDAGDVSTASDASAVTRRLAFPKKKRKRRVSKKWYGRTPEKAGLWDLRRAVLAMCATHCGGCGERFATRIEGGIWIGLAELVHVDHVCPERLILKLCTQDPHEPINLMPLHIRCHGIKTSADRYLCRGDKLRFLEILRRNNWPMERIAAALAFYGF